MALKITASLPNACGSMQCAASANMVNPRNEPVNLMASAAALPLITSFPRSDAAMSLAFVTDLSANLLERR